VLYHAETGIFGAESDVDRNGRVMILFTPVVNGLTPKLGVSCALGYVTGFYYALDVDPAFAADPRSNQAEVLYVMVADSAGTFSCPHSREVAERRGLVTVVHELQHMINFYQHVLVRGGEREDTWLNEGLSHLAEDLVGSALGATGDPRAPAFSDGNLSNAYGFLRRPQETAPVYSAGAGQPEQRGATWLLLRWVAERFGYAAVRRLTETSLVGLDNLAAVAGLSADALLSEWGLANYVADLAGFEAPPALQYGSWPLRAHFAALHAGNPQRFDRVFPLVPLAVSAQGFSVVGTVTAGAPAYYRVVQGPSGGSVALRLTQEDGSALPAASRPTVTVLRVW
jgi:hypothetical protein